MKKSIVILAMAALSTSLINCSNDDAASTKNPEYITVSTNIGSLSRTTTDDKGVQSFVANDKISIYAWTGTSTTINTSNMIVNNSVNTYNGTGWTAAPQMLWKDMTSNHFFLGVYPNKTITDFVADTYVLDVAAQENSDILVALNTGILNAGLKASNNPVALQFDHIMAKLIVNLSYRNQWGGTAPTVASVTVNAKNNATIDYAAKSVTATDTNADIALRLVTANTAYSSIMVPQAGTGMTITIKIGDKDYTYTGTVKLESGKYTTVNLIVGRDEITLGSVIINGWGEGDTIDDGEAQID